MELPVKLADQIEAFLHHLVEAGGVEIRVRPIAGIGPRGRPRRTSVDVSEVVLGAREPQEEVSDGERKDTNKLRRMLSLKQVLTRVPVSRSTLLRMVQESRFPAPRTISSGRVAWFEDEVDAWQKHLREGK